MKLSPTLQSLAVAFQIPLRPSLTTTSSPMVKFLQRSDTQIHPSIIQSSSFSTTPHPLARKEHQQKVDRRITLIRYYLHHPLTPRPLRLSRLRTLRHWTIHRAAQLQHHKDVHTRQLELERLYNSMRAACEELRTGVDDGGRLYRQATSRKGIFGGVKEEGLFKGNGGVPAEYARGQVDGPPSGGWDEGWTR